MSVFERDLFHLLITLYLRLLKLKKIIKIFLQFFPETFLDEIHIFKVITCHIKTKIIVEHEMFSNYYSA